MRRALGLGLVVALGACDFRGALDAYCEGNPACDAGVDGGAGGTAGAGGSAGAGGGSAGAGGGSAGAGGGSAGAGGGSAGAGGGSAGAGGGTAGAGGGTAGAGGGTAGAGGGTTDAGRVVDGGLDASVPVGVVSRVELSSASSTFLAGTCLPITVATRADGGALIAPGADATLTVTGQGVVAYAGDSCLPPTIGTIPYPATAGQLVISVGAVRLDAGLRLGDAVLSATLSTPSLSAASNVLGLQARGVLQLDRSTASGFPFVCEQVLTRVSLTGAAGAAAVPPVPGVTVPLQITGPLRTYQSDGGSDLAVCWTSDAGSSVRLDALGHADFRFVAEGAGSIRALGSGAWSDSNELTVSLVPYAPRITTDAGFVPVGTCVEALLEAIGPTGAPVPGQPTDRFPFFLSPSPGLTVTVVPGCVGALDTSQPLVATSLAQRRVYLVGRAPFPDAGLTFGPMELTLRVLDGGAPATAPITYLAQVTAAPVVRVPLCNATQPLSLSARGPDGGPAFAAVPVTVSYLPGGVNGRPCANTPIPLIWDAGLSAATLQAALFGPDAGRVQMTGDGLDPFFVSW